MRSDIPVNNASSRRLVSSKLKGAGRRELSLWDRIVYGAIAAWFGVFVGTTCALLALFHGVHSHFNWLIVLFGGLYFFFVGMVLGPRAGEISGVATMGSMALGWAELGGGFHGGGSAESEGIGISPTSLLLLVGFALGVVALAFLA